MDTIAVSLPSKHIFPAVFAWSSQAAKSGRWADRRAAVALLSVVSQGCQDPMKERLGDLLPIVFGAIGDPHASVGDVACICLVQFARYLQPEIFEHHSTLIPNLIALMSSPRLRIKESACWAIEALCENMSSEEIGPYLDSLMRVCLSALVQPSTQLDDASAKQLQSLHQTAISAIASLASAGERSFSAYYAQTLQVLAPLMQAQGQSRVAPPLVSVMTLRARATECIGIVAASVGVEVCGNDLAAIMHHAVEGVRTDQADANELREYTYGLFINVAHLLKEGFAGFLPTVMPIVLASCKSDDGIVEHEEEDDEEGAVRGIDSDDEEGEGADGGPNVLSVRTAMLDEKAAACNALGAFALCTRAQFGAYVQESVETLISLANYFHEDVRSAVQGALHYMAFVAHDCYPPPHPPLQPRQSGDSSSTLAFSSSLAAANALEQRPRYWATDQETSWVLSQQAMSVLDVVWPKLLEALTTDDEKDVVGRACESIGELVDALGPGAVIRHMDPLTTALSTLLQRKAPCQCYNDEEEDGDDAAQMRADADGDDGEEVHVHGKEDDEETSESEETLVNAVCECITSLAKALGPKFEPYWRIFAPLLVRYARPSRSVVDRQMAAGCIAEVSNALKSAGQPFVQELLPRVLPLLSEDDMGVRRNAVFCCGVLCEFGGAAALPYYLPLLQSLRPMFEEAVMSASPALTDNAAASVARMIMAAPSAAQLNQVLPIFLSVLPLKSDHEEDVTVFRCLRGLISSGDSALLDTYLGRIVEIFLAALNDKAVVASGRDEIMHAFSMIRTVRPNIFRTLPEQLQSCFA